MRWRFWPGLVAAVVLCGVAGCGSSGGSAATGASAPGTPPPTAAGPSPTGSTTASASPSSAGLSPQDGSGSGAAAVPALKSVDAACPWAVQGDNPPAVQDGGNGLQPVYSIWSTPTTSAMKCATARAEAAGYSPLPETPSTKKLLAGGPRHVVFDGGTEKDVVPLYMNVSSDPAKADTCWTALLVLDYQGNFLFMPVTLGTARMDTLNVAAKKFRDGPAGGLFAGC